MQAIRGRSGTAGRAGSRRTFGIGIVSAVVDPNLFPMMWGMSSVSSSGAGTGAELVAAMVDFAVTARGPADLL